MPQPFLIASLRVFPSQRSPIPLETDWLPCGYPPTTLNAPSSTLLLPVSPTPTLARSSLAPPKAMGPLFTSRSPLPGRPGRWAANHYGSPTSPTSKLWSPCESVPSATWASPDPTADTLLNFVPLQRTPTNLGASNPPSSEELDTHHHPEAPAHDTEDSNPRRRVDTSQSTANRTMISPVGSIPTPFEAEPHRPSAATPSPLTFGPNEQARTTPGLRSF